MTTKKLRVRLNIVVEIDPERWREDYNLDEVEADVKAYLPDVINDFLLQREVGRVVS